jgi:hypothetical protein
MAREVLLFLILFAAGMMILVFAGILWMTAIWEKISLKVRNNTAKMRERTLRIREDRARRTLLKRGVKSL